MRINEMLLVIGDRDVIVRTHADAQDGVILVNDPLKFITMLGVEQGWATVRPAANGAVPADKAGRTVDAIEAWKKKLSEAGKKGAEERWKPSRPRGTSKPVKGQDGMLHSATNRKHKGPRLGSLKISAEDAQRARNAVTSKDGALSPLERNVLRYRLGIGGQPPLTTKEIGKVLLIDHMRVTNLTFRALKTLGIRRHGKRVIRKRAKQPAFMPVMEPQHG